VPAGEPVGGGGRAAAGAARRLGIGGGVLLRFSNSSVSGTATNADE
jgi:hypothetical protein